MAGVLGGVEHRPLQFPYLGATSRPNIQMTLRCLKSILKSNLQPVIANGKKSRRTLQVHLIPFFSCGSISDFVMPFNGDNEVADMATSSEVSVQVVDS
ncbi:hypothetical protein TRIUR3_25315 [Triticum urartu]|uniref:Uncharacterized protein n=1 Tax=Triticum urartu TaxID=4572 RepID=M7ZNM7_TRIUA|nr:hypothetical protein TRIUR3_25315 [Triticum urartu]